MATESIGKMVYLTDEMADRMIEQIEEFEKNPPKPNTREIKWGDPEKIMALWRKQESSEK